MIGKERIIYLDTLRIFSAFAIVWLHVSSQYWSESFYSIGWEVRNVCLSAVRWSVPVFVMISGALFLDIDRPFHTRRLYAKNILRIICAFLFWSFLSQVVNTGFDVGLKALFILTINGPAYLWFIKMLLGLYIFVPVLIIIVSNRRTEIYYLFLSLIVVFIIPLLFDVIGLYSDPFLHFLKGNYEITEINELIDFSSYFVLGHFLATSSICKKTRYIIYMIAVVCLAIVVLGVHFYSICSHLPSTYLYDYTNIFTLMEATAIFLYAKENFKTVPISVLSTVMTISNCSFGIYLIHPFIMDLLGVVFPYDYTSFVSVLVIPLSVMIIFSISLLITKSISFIPILKKYII